MDLPIAPRKTWKSAHSRRIVSASVTMIRPETDAFFKRMAKIRARTVAEVIAEILDGYASERIMEPSLEHLKADPWARNYEVLDAQAV